ncbi:hypothetical protein [Flavobacterium sp.]|uniref:hypothetical protein n=1 Tax=Flavobacterium sp. TaxID=239 RepID=UPI003D2E42AE
MKNVTLVFLISILFLSCTKDNCSESVIPPQASIFIEVLDEDTDENVFTNETYTISDVSVVEFDDSEVDFILITRDDLNLIQIFPRTNVAIDNKIYLNIADDETIEIQYDVETLNTECYTQKRIINVNIPFYTSVEENEILRIKI